MIEPRHRYSGSPLAFWLIGALLVPGAALGLDPTRSIAEFHHTTWTQADGMPANIRAIAQTPDGFLWLGTPGGLYRFDGVRVEHIDHFGMDRLPKVSVTALLVSRSGSLWIGFADRTSTIVRVHDGRITTYTMRDGLPGGTVSNLLDAGDTIWAQLNQRPDGQFVAKLEGERWREITADFGNQFANPALGISHIAAGSDGTIWVKNRSYVYYSRQGADPFLIASDVPGGASGFFRDHGGRLWTIDERPGRVHRLPDLAAGAAASPVESGVESPSIVSGFGLIDRDGTLWCANQQDGGIQRLRTVAARSSSANTVVDAFGRDDGLTDRFARALYEDREGNLWVGTVNGLDRFRAADVVLERRVPIANQFPFIRELNGTIYVYSGASRTPRPANDGSASIYRILPGQPPTIVVRNVQLSNMAARDNRLVYTTDRGERYFLDGDRPVRSIESDTGFPDVGGSVFWKEKEGYFHRVGDKETQLILRPDRPSARARLVFGWRHQVWFYFADGALFSYDGKRTAGFNPDGREDLAGMGSPLYPPGDNQPLLLFGPNGAARFDGQNFKVLPAAIAPEILSSGSQVVLPNGDLWLLGQSGLARTRLADLESAFENPTKPLPYRLFDMRDGLFGVDRQELIGSSIRADGAGKVWFLTTVGLQWIDPAHLAYNPQPPPVVVTHLKADETTHEMPRHLDLPAGTSRLELQYTALSLTVPERIRFRYQLEGVDQQWIDAGGRRQAFYTNIRPGRYLFRVIASNNDGVWNSTGATMSFNIPPTFVQSLWFHLLCALGAILAVWMLYLLRLRAVARQIRARLKARESERENIAREMHDTLLQSTQGLILAFEGLVRGMPADDQTRLKMMRTLERADFILDEGRDRLLDLRSLDSENHDLSRSLALAAEELSESNSVNLRTHIHGAPRPLLHSAHVQAYRIGREAIVNAFSHANANLIEITLTFDDDQLRLVVHDDGRGIDPTVLAAGGRSRHWGFAGMRERAAQIGAALDIRSAPGDGTTVELSIPSVRAYANGAPARTPWSRLKSWLRRLRDIDAGDVS